MPPQVRLSLLGGFTLTADGSECELPKRARLLLSLLALKPPRLRRSDAARQLAPHLEPAGARANLRKALARLRATRLPLIEADRVWLGLHPGVAVDAREAEALAARLSDRSQPLPENPRHELLTRKLLPDWDDGWADRARTGMQGRFLRALDVYARRLDEEDHPYRALCVAQEVWDADPLHESTVVVMVELHLGSGNVGQVLQVYGAFERELAGFGSVPTKALRDLVAPLLAGRKRS
ncbi:MAG: bacterial transcriptional activator domain-containing protein [Chloroflexi bacterium]|nr:bacterial transcriptional activator domain-containing protein [Chloroflexota bacterium]